MSEGLISCRSDTWLNQATWPSSLAWLHWPGRCVQNVINWKTSEASEFLLDSFGTLPYTFSRFYILDMTRSKHNNHATRKSVSPELRLRFFSHPCAEHLDFPWLLYERPGDPKFPVPFSKDPTFASAQATMSTSRALSIGTRFSTCQCTQMPDSHACTLFLIYIRFLVCFSVSFYFLQHLDLTRTAIFSEQRKPSHVLPSPEPAPKPCPIFVQTLPNSPGTFSGTFLEPVRNSPKALDWLRPH